VARFVPVESGQVVDRALRRSIFMSSRFVASIGAGLALLALASGCPDPHGGPRDGVDAGAPDGSAGMDGGGDGDAGPGGQDAGADASRSDGGLFGLDERPRNDSCIAPAKPSLGGVGLQRAFAALRFERPVGLHAAPGDDAHLYVLEQGTGRVKRFPRHDPGPGDVEVMLTLRVEWQFPGEETGLLGLAFDPAFATNGFVYVHYNPRGSVRSVIDRFTLSGDAFDPASRLTILEVEQPYGNHKGGHLAFGPDGHLYIGLGDGGSGGDPHCFAMDPEVLLGKFLRLDVRGATADAPYAIPADNPFASGGGRPEIYALGVRNPWRWSFDRLTGELWMGDVGQVEREEVSIVERGKNYGWKVVEGNHCTEASELSCAPSELFPGHAAPALPKCDDPDLVAPIWDYPRSEGTTITGGYVYRGQKLAQLYGKYVYADFGNGRIWALVRGQTSALNTLIADTGLAVAAFGEDQDGELYAVDWEGGGIHALVASDDEPEDALPALLSQTGCVEPADARQMKAAAIPYDVQVPFWSDGAEKQRWLAIPDGTHVELDADGDFVLPPGGVAIKEFRLGGRRIETRFYVRWADGSYGGYTYRWQNDGTDARLLASSFNSDEEGVPWHYPSRAECERCHHAAAGNHLGLEAIQLDRDFTYPSGRTANQLTTLAHIGILSLPAGGTPEPMVRVDDASAALEARARSYLHANCGHCHRPGGTGRGVMDLRYHSDTPRLCNQAPIEGDLDIPGALIVAPGAVERSLLHVRMARRDDRGMPPLASSQVDEAGARLLSDWIESLQSCP
jgi:uncharacterized repeat protein (TIGR03806 family)